jgi:hypothetical protein
MMDGAGQRLGIETLRSVSPGGFFANTVVAARCLADFRIFAERLMTF